VFSKKSLTESGNYFLKDITYSRDAAVDIVGGARASVEPTGGRHGHSWLALIHPDASSSAITRAHVPDGLRRSIETGSARLTVPMKVWSGDR
jgi:hypothetical protein